tara:strand:- start:892 stop:1584 length:693 start_codon:yes stop_codon:yes gene_type:complete
MKWLRFNEVEHFNDGEYGLDWRSEPPRKYKMVYRGIRVYENGPIEVSNQGARNPDWRHMAYNVAGLDFRLATDLKGCTLVDPTTGLTVSKGLIEGDAPLLFHHELNRLYYVHDWDTIQFLSEHAQPIPAKPVTWMVRDKAKEATVREVLKPYIDLGVTLYTLNRESHGAMYLVNRIVGLAAEGATLGSLEDKEVQAQCRGFGKYINQVDDRIQYHCLAPKRAEYLLVKEK